MFATHLTLFDVAAHIAIAVVVGLAFYYLGERRGRKNEKKELAKKYETAISKFTRRLRDQITKATKAEGSDLIMQAKAIVSTRDQMKSSLEGVARLLNSDLDRLKRVLHVRTEPSEIRELIAVLDQTWEAKPELIELQYRKLLVELGIIEIFQDQGEPAAVMAIGTGTPVV